MVTPPRPRLTVDLDVDVCVVGGGLAGLTVAREVARRGWSTALLEAQRIGWSASGRNTGFVIPGFAADNNDIIARVGLDHARALWGLSESGVDYIRNAIDTNAMPGVELTEGGWLHASKTRGETELASYAERLVSQFGADVEFWPADRVRELLHSPLYFGAIHYRRGYAIHPLNYTIGLAAVAEACGVRIYEQTPALAIDAAGVRKRIVTAQGRVRAGHVVLAANVQLRELVPELGRTLLPIFTYVITTPPLGDALHEAIRFYGSVSDTELADNHYRVVGGDRLMWSGRSTVWRGNPQRYVNPLLWDLARAYPQLADATAEYAWTGVLGNTLHRMPQIGEVSPGLWLLNGFGGHGLNTTAMGGELLARAIVEGDRTWQLFSPFPLVSVAGTAGRIAQQIYYWSYRARERVLGAVARRTAGRSAMITTGHKSHGMI